MKKWDRQNWWWQEKKKKTELSEIVEEMIRQKIGAKNRKLKKAPKKKAISAGRRVNRQKQ